MKKKVLLINSRGRFTLTNDGILFQIGDGFYINKIAVFFDEVIVIAQEIRPESQQNETLVIADNIKCINREYVSGKYLFKLIKLIKKSSLVYTFYPLKSSILVSLIAVLSGKSVVSYNGGVWWQMKNLSAENNVKERIFKYYYQTLEYASIALSKIYIVNNNELFRRYSDRFNLIKTTPFIRITEDKHYHRDDTCEYDLVKILCVSHVKPGKNILSIIKAIQDLNTSSSDRRYQLTVVGKFDKTTEFEKEIDTYIEKNELNKHVTFTGIVNDLDLLISYYRSSDILVLSSESEGFPRVIWESFSQSLPVVCSELPNIKLEFENSQQVPVLYLKSNTFTEVAEKIRLICQNSTIRKQLIQLGLEHYNQKMKTPPEKQFEQILDQLL